MDATAQGARARFLAAVGRLESEQKAPAHLCQACVEALPVQRASIAVHVQGSGLEVLCASDGVAEKVEWTQITLGEGPGVDAVATGGPMVASDLADPRGRWPTFAAEAVKCGVNAVYSLPLEVGAIRVGVLDLYRDTPGALSAKDFADALAVAELVTAILLTVGKDGRITESLGPWWDQPLSTREVHQATGMIVAQLGITAHEAYVRMQGFAYSQGRMLSEVANAVVRRTLRFDVDPDGDQDHVASPAKQS
ncbi:GAF and ANTAR domain-containing protein [Mycolicibacterium sp.]|uniref:GAF and ANTAR domain-containing protein n=1 Tax=Mycolicibacterium sp. TaxID=2320850 RepID=UPI001A26A3DD|nr:GAF and ANTAR domain-containing protein [Mycolicibacterium sp.]MBJ7341061.1 GAF and ANTAR domain-containing protein [Mycolicibacterium sp.]